MKLEFRNFMSKLNEGIPPGINRLVVFDFDGTLVFTPTLEEGLPVYEKETGKPWYIKDSDTAIQHGYPSGFRRKGWWGRKETLEPPIFEPHPDKFNQNLAKVFYSFKNDPETYVVVMTGRMAHSEQMVKKILATYNIHADEYFFQGQKDLTQDPKYSTVKDTFAYKEFVIMNRLMSNEIDEVEIFDDREEHMSKFVELGHKLKRTWPKLKVVLIHDVKQNKNYKI
jgi:hypothetical protein